MSEVLLVTDRYQRARKAHVCHNGCEIRPGQVYRVQFASDRSFAGPCDTAKICLRCDRDPDTLKRKEAVQRGRFKKHKHTG